MTCNTVIHTLLMSTLLVKQTDTAILFACLAIFGKCSENRMRHIGFDGRELALISESESGRIDCND